MNTRQIIRIEIARRRLRQKDLAHAIGLSPCSLSRVLGERQGISLAKLERLLEALDLRILKVAHASYRPRFLQRCDRSGSEKRGGA